MMTVNRTQLRRFLLLEAGLGVGSIILASWLYVYTIGQQQRFTEDLFQHPFSVSNAGMEFRSDVLDLRRHMLETILSPTPLGDIHLARTHLLEERMARHLAIIEKEFLGDQTRVSNLRLELLAWQPIREAIQAKLKAGEIKAAETLATEQVSPHIEQILVDTDYVISFARARALRFVEEGRSKLVQARLLAIILVLILLGGYLWLASHLRQKIYQLYDREEHNATFDGLSGAYNRGAFVRLASAEISRARRHGKPLSLLMLDLDHFKNINDTHGHDAGDLVLRQVASLCKQHLRNEDLLSRIGGEEFAILLPESAHANALVTGERIRQEFAAWDCLVGGDTPLKVTVSIGVATLTETTATIDTLLKQADEALYRAKTQGRNQVASTLPPTPAPE